MGSHSLPCFMGLGILQDLGFWFGILGKGFHSHRYRNNAIQSWQVCCAKGRTAYNRLEETVPAEAATDSLLHLLCGNQIAF